VDDVRTRYHEAIQRKVEDRKSAAAPGAPKGRIIDLMEALKASLAAKAARRPCCRQRAAPAAGQARRRRARHRGADPARPQGGRGRQAALTLSS
jgi:non-homologous end joining protein Ku